MHESKSIQEMIHTFLMQLGELEQVSNLYKVEHMQDNCVSLFCYEVTFYFSNKRVNSDKDSKD